MRIIPPPRVPSTVARTISATIAVALVIASFASLSTAKPAHAAPAQPPTDWSFYVLDGSYTTIKTLGCNQGKFDASTGHNSVVVLDFGVQRSDGSGTTATFSYNFLSTAAIEQMALWFAAEYYSCTGSDSTTILNLALGTNDSVDYGSATYTTLGKDWANVVSATTSAVASDGYSSQVNIWAANDIETWDNNQGFYIPTGDAYGWVNGYSSLDPAPYVNYGSANGCPFNGYDSSQWNNEPCSFGYKQADYYWFSWGAAPALVAPEIYYSANAVQWTDISLYAKNDKGVSMQFVAPWDENDIPGASGTNTSAQAWADLSNDLASQSVPSYMGYSMEIHCEYSGQC